MCTPNLSQRGFKDSGTLEVGANDLPKGRQVFAEFSIVVGKAPLSWLTCLWPRAVTVEDPQGVIPVFVTERFM